MNVFVLAHDPVTAAQLHCDKHVVKMPLETAQLLSTALHQHRCGAGAHLYAPTHERHPCALWAAETRANFEWLVRLGLALVAEHALRYAHTAAGKRGHASRIVIESAAALASAIPAGPLTPFAQAMPEECKHPDPVVAYRQYYATHKRGMATWRPPRSRPAWMSALEHDLGHRVADV